MQFQESFHNIEKPSYILFMPMLYSNFVILFSSFELYRERIALVTAPLWVTVFATPIVIILLGVYAATSHAVVGIIVSYSNCF